MKKSLEKVQIDRKFLQNFFINLSKLFSFATIHVVVDCKLSAQFWFNYVVPVQSPLIVLEWPINFPRKTLRKRSQKVERAESAKFFIWFSFKSLKLKSWKFYAMILSPGTIAVALCLRIRVHRWMEKFASNFYFSSSPSFFITDTRPLQVH